MVKLTSTYNFAPISKTVFVPKWHNEVSYDHPFSDGEDGVIEMTLSNVSPLFTRDGTSQQINECPSEYSAHILCPDGKRWYYLPATSLKGMLRSTMEMMTFGRMKQYENRYFGHREFGKTNSNKEYQLLMSKVSGGWLTKEGESYKLTPCSSAFRTIPMSEIHDYVPSYSNDKTSSWERNKDVNMYPTIKYEGNNYQFVCTGKIDKKDCEYLFPIEGKQSYELTTKEIQSFLTVHEQTPFFENYLEELENGKKIAVFFVEGRNGLKYIGLSKMIKIPYQYGLQEIVEKQQPLPNGHDLADIIWGYVDAKECLKGRVHVGHAFSSIPLSDDMLLDKQSGILGQPKPSFYPLYLKQDKSPYKTYDNTEGIAGRKLYRIHQGSSVSPLPNKEKEKEKENTNVLTHLRAIPAGQTFSLRITVHNLRPIEIGALLSVITFHKTSGVYHNLGQAKGFGYGKLQIKNLKLFQLSKSIDEYLKDFEREMTLFTQITFNKKWNETEEIKKTLGILSEHADNEVVMMSIDNKDFSNIKDEKNFQKLEDEMKVNSLLSKEDFDEIDKRQKEEKEHLKQIHIMNHFQDDIRNAKKMLDEGLLDNSLRSFHSIDEKAMRLYSTSLIEVRDYINYIEKEIEIKRAKQIEVEKETQIKNLLENGFDKFINEKYAMGPDAGQFKVKDFKTFQNKVNQWLKKNKRKILTDEEKQILVKVILRLKDAPVRKEAKDWASANSRIWKQIRIWLGEGWTGSPFDN